MYSSEYLSWKDFLEFEQLEVSVSDGWRRRLNDVMHWQTRNFQQVSQPAFNMSLVIQHHTNDNAYNIANWDEIILDKWTNIK